MKRLALLAILLLPLLAGAGSRGGITGFSPTRAAWEREYERRLLSLPRPKECGRLLRELTRTPHLAGTEGASRVAAFIAAEYRRAGLEVEEPAYEVLLSYPRSGSLEILGEPELRLPRREEPIPADPDTDVPEAAVAWNAYAPSADVTAEVVYANRGRAEDYERLRRLGIDVKGKIVLARYFGGYRGGKSQEAERRGVAAMLVYSDPIDDGWFRGPVYPEGPWGPLSHFQRGANVYDFLVPGDPLTPGWASTRGARRLAEADSKILPKVPMMPLSARDAAVILERLGGQAVPEGWQGVAVPATYRTGPGPVRVRLRTENTREVRTIRNVIGILRGTDEPERRILLSNHHDAWVYGAVDPSSGTASLIALARAFGQLAREGFRPRRTIVFGSWDAEEYTLTGSTEWGEEHESELSRDAVVCINVDASASGRDFSASASPLLFSILREVARDLPDPGASGRSIADAWRERAGRQNVRSYATGAAAGEELPVAILGSGSDYTVFFNRLGVSSADLIFDGPYGVYHSVYDTYRWMEQVGDPGFLYHAAMAQYAGLLALRFANADAFPFDAPAYGREIARYSQELAAEPGAKGLAPDLESLARRAREWSDTARGAQRVLAARVASGHLTGAALRRYNEWLLSLERGLLDPAGLPGRPWFRHLIYAPLPSYEAETLPGVREALRTGGGEAARREIARLARKLEAAAAAGRRLARTVPLARKTSGP